MSESDDLPEAFGRMEPSKAVEEFGSRFEALAHKAESESDKQRRIVQAIVNPTAKECVDAAVGDHFSPDMCSDRSQFLVADGKLWILESVAAETLIREMGRERS